MVQSIQASRGTRRPWPSQAWCRYFRRNAQQLLDIPWEAGDCLSPDERAAIADSVREFQLGESAEGRHFVRAAKAYAERSGDRDYVDAVRLLIAEEQRHVRDLAHFLSLAGIPLAQRTWADSAFRWLRKRAGLEVCVSVLLAAEVIAKVYYAALAMPPGPLCSSASASRFSATKSSTCGFRPNAWRSSALRVRTP